MIQTIIRPAAGAIAFAASARVITDVHPILALGSGLLIGGSVHLVNAGAVRPVVTATTVGAGTIPVFIAEDAISTFISMLAIIFRILVIVPFFIWHMLKR